MLHTVSLSLVNGEAIGICMMYLGEATKLKANTQDPEHTPRRAPDQETIDYAMKHFAQKTEGRTNKHRL
jgi:hypothetical protein